MPPVVQWLKVHLDVDSIPVQELRSHAVATTEPMLWGLCPTAIEATAEACVPHLESRPHSPQLERAGV